MCYIQTMRHAFTCPPIRRNPGVRPLVFGWDPETGEVDGPGAEIIRQRVQDGAVIAHPMPWGWTLGPDPLRSWRDMAAIVGSEWLLPAELEGHYPEPPIADDGKITDEAGRVIGEVLY